ncbi:MAG: phage tail protein [Methylobacter sp.]|jgi:phage tail-like protein|nr:phage tail protein [Methylobacter sp.]
MAQSTETIKSAYPLPVYNYRVTILNDGAANVLGFSEVSGLSVEYEPVTYKHGWSFMTGVQIVPGMRKPIHLTLKRGLTRNGDFLQTWLNSCYLQPWSVTGRRDIVIDLCDEKGLPVIRWKVKQALPTKLEAPTFTASSNEVAIISMELIAADLEADYHPS